MKYIVWRALVGAIVILLGIIMMWDLPSPISQEARLPAPVVADHGGQATSSGVLVTEVVDGDTIKLETGQTVRLIGIDTPETKDPRRPVGCFGKEASAETKKLLEGRRVILEKDISETDKYDRLLRYIYLPLDPSASSGQMLFVNDYLIREGFAYSLTYPPDVKYNERLREAEREARENNRGLWGKC